MRQTTLCYLDDGRRYLMLHRVKKEHDPSHGKWIGVGGKCEAEESIDECMVREVREETGLTVSRWQYRGIVTFISDTWEDEYMHLFTADRWSGSLADNCDEGELSWVDKDKVGELCLWDGDRIFLSLMADASRPYFSLKLVYAGDRLTSAKLDGVELDTGKTDKL
ncbi:MAG: 8-oxo-dGTP diphosphatase [Bacteroidales bacterium]|nr:8-oxo-dGTP diphosphatase [Bacteroidales bacterium]